MSRLLNRILLAVFLLGAACAVVLFVVGGLLTKPVPASIGAAPADLHAENVELPNASGAAAHAWWCPVPQSHATVVLLPGVRANRLSMIGRAEFLHEAGFSTLLLDFRATGETPGRHITFGWDERYDVRGAVAFLRRTKPANRVFLIGSSLGGAAALLAVPPLRVDAMVLESVYPTIERATDNRMRNYLGPIGPLASRFLLMQLPKRLGISREQLRPIDHIGAIACPLLIINGAEDRNTTPEDSALLFAQAHEPKQLWLVEKAGHVDLHAAAPAEYEQRVLAFFKSSEAGTPPNESD